MIKIFTIHSKELYIIGINETDFCTMIKKLLLSTLFIFYITVFAQEDCNTAITVCGNSNINYTPSGIGNINENLGGCLSGEHNSVWYKFTIATSGTLTFDLTPTGPVDYDWAIYGPNVNCNNLGFPVRCNASGNFGSTGMNLTNTNTSSAGGNTNRYCKYMDVLAGQTYYLYIDNWSPTVFTFNLTWGGTATFVSPFTSATIAPHPFIPPGNAGPNANSPREIPICGNTTTFDFSTLSAGILNGNANFSVTYFSNTNDAATGNNPITMPVAVNTANTYYYSINYNDPNNPNNSINSCRQTNSIIFKDKSITTTITTSSTTICPNGSVTLTSSNATGNTWSTGETAQTITVIAPGTYTLTSTNGICTSPTASVTITQDTDPNVQITGNLVLCEAASTQLTATSTGTGNTYMWSNGTNGSTINVNTPGNYTVTVKTLANCQYQKSVTVIQGTVPVVQNASLSNCSNTGTATFDLTSAEPNISTTPGVNFAYYINQADALVGNTNTIANPAAHVSGNATIFVLVKSATCSKVAELQLNISQFASPTITASSQTICFGGSITLTSSNTTGNTWSTGETTQSIVVNTPGTYTLTSSNGNCTSQPVSITIAAENDPNLQITGNLIFCESPIQLTASANGTGNNFTWSNGTTGATATIAAPGIYTVTLTTSPNCQYQKTVTVTQGTVPVVQNTSLSNCSNTGTATFDLTSAEPNISTTPGVNFAYYINQADALVGNTNTIANPAAHVSGNATIFVLVKSATCSKVAELQLILNQNPVAVITASSNIICGNNSIILNSNFATGNIWSTGETTQNITVTTPGIYTLTNNNGICTSEPASMTITQDADPNIQITGNTTFCEGFNTTLTATTITAGNTFVWSNGTNGATNTVAVGGTYTVTVTTPGGCQFQKSVTVIMNPAPIVNIAAPAQINCTNLQIILNAAASVFQQGATFLWTATGGGNIVAGANTLTPTVNDAGTYTLAITNPSGCTSQGTVNVVKDATAPAITVAATKITICNGETVVLTAFGAASYTWTGLTGNGNTQTVSPSATTIYTVTGTGANGCTAQAPATITINVVPDIVSTLKDILICKGDTAILDAGAGTNYTYLWNTGAVTQTIAVEQPGIYTVTINNGVCTKSFASKVSYIVTPEISEIIYNDHTLTINVNNTANQVLEYSIDNGFTWQPSNIFTRVLKNTLYTIRVRYKGATCDTNTEYYTFFMSNVITPNNDGKNDVIDFSEISKYGNFKGSIVDRYGKTIFTVNMKNPVWDGNYLGRPAPTGTYWYRLSWQDRINKKDINLSGWILLKNRD